MVAPAPVVVVARWHARGDGLGDVLALVARLRIASLAEPGCLGYEVFQGVDAPGTVLLLEHYRDDAALEAHRQSAHYRSLVLEGVLPLLSWRQVEILRPRAAAAMPGFAPA